MANLCGSDKITPDPYFLDTSSSDDLSNFFQKLEEEHINKSLTYEDVYKRIHSACKGAMALSIGQVILRIWEFRLIKKVELQNSIFGNAKETPKICANAKACMDDIYQRASDLEIQKSPIVQHHIAKLYDEKKWVSDLYNQYWEKVEEGRYKIKAVFLKKIQAK